MDWIKRSVPALALGVLFVAIGCSSSEPEAEPATTGTSTETGGTDAAPMVTVSQVMEVFTEHCMPCHSAAGAQEELVLDSVEGLMKGSEHGPVVTAGDAEGSMVIQAIRGKEGVKKMPPQGAPPVPEEKIKLIEDWINAGAKTE